MFRSRLWIIVFISFIACQSDENDSSDIYSDIYYQDLNDSAVSYLNPVIVDLNGDTTGDIRFTTSLIGRIDGSTDLTFIAYPYGGVLFQINGEEIPVFQKDDPIGSVPANANTWDRSFDILTAKRYFPDGDSAMIGSWKNVVNGYLPVKLTVNDTSHFAWIRLSVDSVSTKVILHDCAVNQTAGQPILAGQTE